MNLWDELHKKSYSVYSQINSACIVVGSSGIHYPGVRIENASFPLTIAASQSALFSCLSEGDSPLRFLIPHNFVDERIEYLATFHKIPVELVETLTDIWWFDPKSNEEPVNLDTLKKLQKRAIAEESNFKVSCIIETDQEIKISGINIEYPDWQIGLCAERIALSKAISLGYHSIKSIHINASSGEFISPCGACRQVLVEHLPYKNIHLYHPDGTKTETTAAQLLPAFFNGSSLR